MSVTVTSEWSWERVAYCLSLTTQRSAADIPGGPFLFGGIRADRPPRQFGDRLSITIRPVNPYIGQILDGPVDWLGRCLILFALPRGSGTPVFAVIQRFP